MTDAEAHWHLLKDVVDVNLSKANITPEELTKHLGMLGEDGVDIHTVLCAYNGVALSLMMARFSGGIPDKTAAAFTRLQNAQKALFEIQRIRGIQAGTTREEFLRTFVPPIEPRRRLE